MVILKGHQHNWYRRILKKINLGLTLSRKEFKYYEEINKDNGHICHSKILFVNQGGSHDTR